MHPIGMKVTGNTIFITGGGSGIGRGLAEALHAAGNQVIISGRRKEKLADVTQANAGMDSIELDLENTASIAAAAKTLTQMYPKLNVLINNAGIMLPDHVQTTLEDATVSSVITTNLLGPMRMTSALIEELKTQPASYVINVTSGLGFRPLAMTATYSATKAALHSYTLSQRYLLKDTSVKLLELIPPYVQTELMGAGQAEDPRAMPLKEFIAEVMTLLATDVNEILVQRVIEHRTSAGLHDYEAMTRLNDLMSAGHSEIVGEKKEK
jgi:uncharacterized oxidoreductase